MSKYLDQLSRQLEGKNIKEFTKHCKADHDLSKILKEQNEDKRRAKVKADIQKLLRR